MERVTKIRSSCKPTTITESKRGARDLGGSSGSGPGSALSSNQTLEGRRSQMAHFRQPEVANSAPPARQSAYRAGRTIHRLLQLWCFGQFRQEILPLWILLRGSSRKEAGRARTQPNGYGLGPYEDAVPMAGPGGRTRLLCMGGLASPEQRVCSDKFHISGSVDINRVWP